MTMLMNVGDVLGEIAIHIRFGSILRMNPTHESNENEEDQVESREKSRREVDILSWRLTNVVATV